MEKCCQPRPAPGPGPAPALRGTLRTAAAPREQPAAKPWAPTGAPAPAADGPAEERAQTAAPCRSGGAAEPPQPAKNRRGGGAGWESRTQERSPRAGEGRFAPDADVVFPAPGAVERSPAPDGTGLAAAFAAAEAARLQQASAPEQEPEQPPQPAAPCRGGGAGRESRTQERNLQAGEGLFAPDTDAVSPAPEVEAVERSPSPAGTGLAAAFAAAEALRRAQAGEPALEQEPPAEEDPTAAAPVSAATQPPAAPDTAGLDAALDRALGWGATAGSSLAASRAAAALLDWGEDAQAAQQDPEALAAAVGRWLQRQQRADAETLRENWPRIAAHGSALVRGLAPHAGRLADAGNPLRRSAYHPAHWAAVRQAVEQALNGA